MACISQGTCKAEVMKSKRCLIKADPGLRGAHLAVLHALEGRAWKMLGIVGVVRSHSALDWTLTKREKTKHKILARMYYVLQRMEGKIEHLPNGGLISIDQPADRKCARG